MKFSWYLVIFLKFCLKPTNLINFLYLDYSDYKGAICDFQDNVTIEGLTTISNICSSVSCFNSNMEVVDLLLFLNIDEATD